MKTNENHNQEKIDTTIIGSRFNLILTEELYHFALKVVEMYNEKYGVKKQYLYENYKSIMDRRMIFQLNRYIHKCIEYRGGSINIETVNKFDLSTINIVEFRRTRGNGKRAEAKLEEFLELNNIPYKSKFQSRF